VRKLLIATTFALALLSAGTVKAECVTDPITRVVVCWPPVSVSLAVVPDTDMFNLAKTAEAFDIPCCCPCFPQINCNAKPDGGWSCDGGQEFKASPEVYAEDVRKFKIERTASKDEI
jgi:hypothetical protein